MRRTSHSLLWVFGLASSIALALNRLRQEPAAGQFDDLKPAGVKSRSPQRSVGDASVARAETGQGAKAGQGAKVGQGATSPSEIPLPGWRQIIKRTISKFSENELMSEAASVTFFALLALFPAITAMVSIYGLFADPASIRGHIESAGSLLPSGGLEIIREQVQRLTQSPASKLGFGAIFGVLAAIWSANQGSKAMFSALNVVYGEHEDRGFIKLTATSLAFTAGGIVFLLVGIGVIVVIPIVFNALGLSSAVNVTLAIGRWPAIVLVLMMMLSVLYRYGPSRRPARWRWVTWGGAFAALAWIGLSVGFSWYVASFGSYNKTYGSLGAIIGFMTWMWLSSTVLLLGGQLNAELELQTARDSTVEGERQRGRRGAKVADGVSAAA